METLCEYISNQNRPHMYVNELESLLKIMKCDITIGTGLPTNNESNIEKSSKNTTLYTKKINLLEESIFIGIMDLLHQKKILQKITLSW